MGSPLSLRQGWWLHLSFSRSGGEFVYLCVLWHRCPIDCGSVWGIPPGGSPPLSFPARLLFLSAAVSLRTAPPSSDPWKFGTNELTAELPPRSLVPNYTVLHTRFILQMARLRSPAGGATSSTEVWKWTDVVFGSSVISSELPEATRQRM